jgi:hypothetical protein
MAKISDTSSYPQAVVTGSDYLIGTDSADTKDTKTFTVDSLSTYILGGAGAAYVVPVYVSGTQFGNSIISQDAAVGTEITIAGGLVVSADISLAGLVSSNQGIETLYLANKLATIQNVIVGTDDSDTLTIEATTGFQGPIRDAAGALGVAGQTLVSNASGQVFWT